MKRLFFLLWMTGIGCLTMAKNPVGKIEFEKTSFHFGTFEKRIVRTCVFVLKIREALLSSSIRPIPLATVLPSALTKPPYCLIKKVISPSYTMASITTRGILEKASTFGRMQRMVWCDCLSLVQQSKRWYYWIIFFKKTFKYDDIKN